MAKSFCLKSPTEDLCYTNKEIEKITIVLICVHKYEFVLVSTETVISVHPERQVFDDNGKLYGINIYCSI